MLDRTISFAVALRLLLPTPAAADDCYIPQFEKALAATLAARDHLFDFEETEPVNAEAIGSLHVYLRQLNIAKHIAESCEHAEAKASRYRLMLLERKALGLLEMANKAAAADFAWMIEREKLGGSEVY